MSNWASTERIPAQVTLAESVVLQGDIHLQPQVGHHDGPETPLEMLNRPESFFPVTLEGGQIAFAAKAQVAMVSCDPGIALTEAERASAAKTIRLDVTMAGGHRVEGWASLELPPTRNRTLDYLNEPGLFFLLRTEGATCYLNRMYVRVVQPAD
jgi:hypothetical protein